MYIILTLELCIPVLINIAFFTLLERKILGYSQIRKGPNKLSWGGILQPFSDAMKLFSKEMVKPVSSSTVFWIAPALSLTLMLMLWSVLPLMMRSWGPMNSSLLLLVLMSLSLYPLLLAGWASNSKYAMIGAVRGVAQTLSYEISLMIILFSALLYGPGFNLSSLTMWSEMSWTIIIGLPMFMCWLISCIAETNRTPFDFAEGESELVSGFNVEYGSGGFALVFMAEYGSILFFSFVTPQLFLGAMGLFLSWVGIIICCFWVWVRATLPRLRYDILMSMAWKFLLPFSLSVMLFNYSLSL